MVAGSDQYAHAMAFFVLTMVHGSSWDASRQIREQHAWGEHAAFMDGLVDDGAAPGSVRLSPGRSGSTAGNQPDALTTVRHEHLRRRLLTGSRSD